MFSYKGFLLFLITFLTTFTQAQTFRVNGYIYSKLTGEALSKATISSDIGVVNTSSYGFYSIALTKGEQLFTVNSNGYESLNITLQVSKDTIMDFYLSEIDEESMNLVNISVKKKISTRSLDVGNQQVSGATIKKIPAFLGEADVIKAIQLLPGVSTAGEGASGFNVRGGAIDQNLVLLDEAPVYNSSHLFGFFSVFNPDAVKEVELYKGGIESKFGGRLASILEVKTKEGNNNNYKVEGGIGTIFSRLLVEGPIVKGKSSFVVSGRRSYIDILARPFIPANLKGNQFYFYDLTAKVNYKYKQNKFYLSTYIGDDVFSAPNLFGVKYGNKTITGRWNKVISRSLFANFTYFYTQYRYNIEFKNRDNSFNWDSYIKNHGVKADASWYLNPKNQISYGLHSTHTTFIPGSAVAKSGNSVVNFSLPNKYGMESAAYISNEQTVNNKLALRYGFRLTNYLYLGSGKVYTYKYTNAPLQSIYPTKTTDAKRNEVIASYFNLEPRFSARYEIKRGRSIKLGYNRMTQNTHLISNTSASVPFDVYTPSTNNIKPEIADQISLGYFNDFKIKNYLFEASIEGFHKEMQNQVDYVDGANLLLNPNLEGDLRFGIGRSYGLELFLKKASGNLTGWISYTIARSERKTNLINNNEWYAARFDKLHNLNITATYTLDKQWELGANFAFSTGTPTTFYESHYQIQGIIVPDIGGSVRNNVRNPIYKRFDLSATLHKSKKAKFESDWVFSLYNVFNTRNPFSIYFDTENEKTGQNEAIRYSIIGSLVPAVSYNFKFK